MPAPPNRSSIVDVLPRLSADRRSGRLRVRTAAGDRTIYLVRGTPELVTSSVAGERVGETLLRKGLLRKEEIDPLLKDARAANRRFDTHLQIVGRLDAELVRKTILDLSLNIYASLLRDADGEPLFTALDRPVDDGVRIGRPAAVVHSLVVDRIPDDRALRRISDPGGPFRLSADPYRLLAVLPLGTGDVEFLSKIGPDFSFEDVVRLHPAGERRALRSLAWMRLSGLLESGAAAAKPVDPPPPPPARFPWNRWTGEEMRRGGLARFRAEEIASREAALTLLDRAAGGLARAGLSADETWQAAGRLHPDHSQSELMRDLAAKLHVVFPRLFDRSVANSAPETHSSDKDERIRRRRTVSSHLELAAMVLASGYPGLAFDLLVRAAELDPARSELDARFRAVVDPNPQLVADAIASLARLSPATGSPLRSLLSSLESRRSAPGGLETGRSV